VNLPLGKKWVSWPRFVALGVTGALLLLIFRQLPLETLGRTLLNLQPIWLLGAFGAYGLALLLGGLRSHVAYRLADRAVHTTASCRAFLAGHFFFVILLGAAAGDIAKAAVYARWYQFRMAEVLAAAPLDRVLAFSGTIALALAAAAIVVANHGFERIQQLNIRGPADWVWIVGGIGFAAAAMLLLLWVPQGEAAWKRTLRTFRTGVLRLMRTRRLAANGFVRACLAQGTMSTVIALNLAAVTQHNVHWGQIAWTFPAITFIGSVPFTVAGAGVREAAALTLLGLYAVPPGECVAAALLTLVTRLAWAGVGAAVLWREESLFTSLAALPQPQTISVLIASLNNATSLTETVTRAKNASHVCEVIIVDGGSSDGTSELAEKLGCRVIAQEQGHGGLFGLGAAEAKGDVSLFLQPDTLLPLEAGDALLNCLRDRAVVAGGFWKVFRRPIPPLLIASKLRCGLRLLLGHRIDADQGLFVRREALQQIGSMPAAPALMQELELCRRLRRLGRLALADATVVASVPRLGNLGATRSYWRMWWVAMLYRLGVSSQRLRHMSEPE
jgi:uncharacterized membrane protein YbhN (UPF0104 family)